MEPAVNGRRRAIAAAGIILLGALFAAGWLESAAQEPPPTSLKPAAAEPGHGDPAAARPAKERMAVYVILAWVWFSIAVLLGFLRSRVREADRVHRMGLYRAGEGPAKGPGH
jgi:uncharacterized membrane protein YphA (DoxX/SURF4 family)